MAIYPFENGMTVKELKALIKDWPELDRDDEPTQVWIETGRGLTSPVCVAMTLNLRQLDDGTETSDIVFESNAFEQKFE